MIVLGVFRTSEAPQPVALGNKWMSVGDSHNFGYGSSTCLTPYHAFARIAQTRGISGIPTTPYTNIRTSAVYQDGVSGRSLAETLTHYNGRSERTDRTLVMFQESGNQNLTGQTTATAFGDTWDDFIDAILLNTPNAIIVYETAGSFRRGPPWNSETYRAWPPYNDELRVRIAARNLPNQIFLAETDRDIALLEDEIGVTNVWWQSNESNPYHYKSVGNLMIALSIFKALRYEDLTLADLADIGTGVVSEEWQQVCLDIYNAN